MPSSNEFREIQRRYWRRSLLIAVALLAVYLPLDVRFPKGGRAAAWRFVWILILSFAAMVQRPAWPRLARAAAQVACGSSGVIATVIVAYTGGSFGPRFGFLIALPPLAMLLMPDLSWAGAIAAVGALGGGIAIVAGDGREPGFILEWGLLSFAISVLAAVGSFGFRRVWLSEVSAQRAHGETLERLAESERRRAQAERLAVVGRLAAGVAHEINNPLSVVKSCVQQLGRLQPSGDASAAETRESLDEAMLGIERIAQIVDDMRNLSRDAPDSSSAFSAGEAVREAWRLASLRLGRVHARCDAPFDLPLVRGSQRLLVQALVNLLANAADAAESAPDPDRRWVSLVARSDGVGVTLAVEDGGPGLAPAVAEHLFEPFFSTKGAKGTGLGLALVREQVARCGGTVEGANRPDGGARFTVWLPVGNPATPNPSQGRAAHAGTSAPLRGLTPAAE